jgi:hypothetical protein
MKYLTLLLLLLCTTASADSIYLGGWSFHPNPTDEVNNSSHEMVVYERHKWFAGTFRNSFNHQTFVAGREIPMPVSQDFVEFSFLVGVSHGYRECYGAGEVGDRSKNCFVLAPNLKFKTDGPIKPSVLIFGGAVILAARIDW